jgi:hypothetical protein
VTNIPPHYTGNMSIVILEDARPLVDERGKFFYVQEWGDEFPDRWKSFVPHGTNPLGRYNCLNGAELNLIQEAIAEANSGKRTSASLRNILSNRLKNLF